MKKPFRKGLQNIGVFRGGGGGLTKRAINPTPSTRKTRECSLYNITKRRQQIRELNYMFISNKNNLNQT